MVERGNTTHGPALDESMKHEARKIVQGNQPAHAEEFRESEPFPDDTDPEEIRAALQPPAEQAPLMRRSRNDDPKPEGIR